MKKAIITVSKHDMSGTVTVDGVTERYSYSMGKAKYNLRVRSLGLTNESATALIVKARDEHMAVILNAIKEHGYCSDGHIQAIKTAPHSFEYSI